MSRELLLGPLLPRHGLQLWGPLGHLRHRCSHRCSHGWVISPDLLLGRSRVRLGPRLSGSGFPGFPAGAETLGLRKRAGGRAGGAELAEQAPEEAAGGHRPTPALARGAWVPPDPALLGLASCRRGAGETGGGPLFPRGEPPSLLPAASRPGGNPRWAPALPRGSFGPSPGGREPSPSPFGPAPTPLSCPHLRFLNLFGAKSRFAFCPLLWNFLQTLLILSCFLFLFFFPSPLLNVCFFLCLHAYQDLVGLRLPTPPPVGLILGVSD